VHIKLSGKDGRLRKGGNIFDIKRKKNTGKME
jgi:hypothetical protein